MWVEISFNETVCERKTSNHMVFCCDAGHNGRFDLQSFLWYGYNR